MKFPFELIWSNLVNMTQIRHLLEPTYHIDFKPNQKFTSLNPL